jgi:hypothetical protein
MPWIKQIDRDLGEDPCRPLAQHEPAGKQRHGQPVELKD